MIKSGTFVPFKLGKSHIKFIQSLSSRSQGPIYFTTLEHGQFYITEVSELNPQSKIFNMATSACLQCMFYIRTPVASTEGIVLLALSYFKLTLLGNDSDV